MKIKCLYANGDSFVFGQGLDPEKITSENVYSFTELKRTNGFTGIICDTLGIDHYINNALPGGSNDRMLRTTIQDLIKLKQTYKPEEVLVVLGFTESQRSEFYVMENRNYMPYMPSCPPNTLKSKKVWETYLSYCDDEIQSQYRYITNIISLQSFLVANGFNYVFTETVQVILGKGGFLHNHAIDQTLVNEIDINHYVNPSFSHYDSTLHLPRSECHHPLAPSHKLWAEYVLNFMKEKGIV